MCTSVVKLLFKKGDRRLIGNYRPLSFACTDYKNLAKIITERVKPMLKDIIGTEHQGFIQGRDITGNLMLVRDTIEYCNEHGIEAYMIMMEFMKAYDRIDRATMVETLEAMNVSETIIDLVKLLYEESTKILILDDEKENKFRTKGRVLKDVP